LFISNVFIHALGQLRLKLAHQMKGDIIQPMYQTTDNSFSSQSLGWSSSKLGDLYANQNQIRMPLPPGRYVLAGNKNIYIF